MDPRINKIAALANAVMYTSEHAKKYEEGAPHVKHRALRELYGRLVVDCYDYALRSSMVPKILDLGAGDGSVTLPFLELGAEVTAVDVAVDQLQLLQNKCAKYGNKLTVLCGDTSDVLRSMQREEKQFNIVVANSFLHHIPDYIGLISLAVQVIGPKGQFFTFQDPLRYDSLGKPTYLLSTLAYFCWRIFQGDIVAGAKRRIRRNRGLYQEEGVEDNIEYHVARNGVDHGAIQKLLNEFEFDCKIIRYFSTQSRMWQKVGSLLHAENSFSVVARKVL